MLIRLLIFILLGGTMVNAQSSPLASLAPISIDQLPARFGGEFVDTAVDYPQYWTTPLRWQEKEWTTFWTVVGVSGALILVDSPLFDYFHPDHYRAQNKALQGFHELGQWQHTAIILSGGYVGSYILQDPKMERASRIAIKSFLFQSFVNQGMKNIIYRYKQPSEPFDFRLFPPDDKWEMPSSGAFPSGHASNMWAMLSGYALAYKDDPVIPWICYGSAIIGSSLLVTKQNHWISDIVLGAALGYYSAEYMLYVDDQRTGYQVTPVVTAGGAGVQMRF